MAPEQLAALTKAAAVPATPGPVTCSRAGVVLFELLTGRHPFGEPAALATRTDRDGAAAILLARTGPAARR